MYHKTVWFHRQTPCFKTMRNMDLLTSASCTQLSRLNECMHYTACSSAFHPQDYLSMTMPPAIERMLSPVPWCVVHAEMQGSLSTNPLLLGVFNYSQRFRNKPQTTSPFSQLVDFGDATGQRAATSSRFHSVKCGKKLVIFTVNPLLGEEPYMVTSVL